MIGEEEGFSYIETVWYLCLLSLLLPALFFMSHIMELSIKEGMERERLQMEWLAFVPQLERDIRQGVRFYQQDGAFIIDLVSKESVRYELKKRQIIRSVKKQGEDRFRGNMLMMQDVYYALFLPQQQGIMVDVGLQGWHTHLDFSLFLAKRSLAHDTK